MHLNRSMRLIPSCAQKPVPMVHQSTCIYSSEDLINSTFNFPAVVTIGFDETMYAVFEGDVVTVCVSLQTGQLATDRDVVVTVATDDMSGSGGPISELLVFVIN